MDANLLRGILASNFSRIIPLSFFCLVSFRVAPMSRCWLLYYISQAIISGLRIKVLTLQSLLSFCLPSYESTKVFSLVLFTLKVLFFFYFTFLLIQYDSLCRHELADFIKLKRGMYTKFAQLNKCGKHSYENIPQRISTSCSVSKRSNQTWLDRTSRSSRLPC